MKETELWEILVSLSANEISLAETHDQILRLFNVVGRSEQLKAFLSAMIEDFDNGEVSWETRDSAESLLKSL